MVRLVSLQEEARELVFLFFLFLAYEDTARRKTYATQKRAITMNLIGLHLDHALPSLQNWEK